MLNYNVSYEFQSATENLNITVNSDGVIVLNGLTAGQYEKIIVNQNGAGCSDNLGDVFLEASELITN